MFVILLFFLTVSPTSFINNLEFSSDLTIFTISLISSLEIIKVVRFANSGGLLPVPNIFL